MSRAKDYFFFEAIGPNLTWSVTNCSAWVKRLFAWMIPRFDTRRFHVSLLSLRKKDLSEEKLEDFGFPVYYLEKSRFDPTTLPSLVRLLKRLEALQKWIRKSRADIEEAKRDEIKDENIRERTKTLLQGAKKGILN